MNTEKQAESGAPQRDARLRAALLSGLVFPGVGQLRYGQRGRGLAFAFGAGVPLLALLRRIVGEVRTSLPPDPSLLGIGEILQMAHAIQARAFGALWGWFALLAAIWLASVWDALRIERQAPP